MNFGEAGALEGDAQKAARGLKEVKKKDLKKGLKEGQKELKKNPLKKAPGKPDGR